MVEWLVLVDEADRELGVETRENCHRGRGKRHRAFVVFLFNRQREVLLQQRSARKQLWPGYWDVSVTSHVYPQETYEGAATRRLRQELGIPPVPLRREFSFVYEAPFDGLAENEFCVLLTGEYEGAVRPDPAEVAAWRYAGVEAVRREVVAEGARKYTPWFLITWERFRQAGGAGERSRPA